MITKARLSTLYCKVKLSRYRYAGDKGKRHSSYSFLTLALDGVSGQRRAPATLYPRGKGSRYPLDRRLGGPQSWYGYKGQTKKSSASVGDRTPSPSL
jgi:hypothetical protein